MTIYTSKSTVIRQIAYVPGTVFVTFRNGAEYAYSVPRKRAFKRFAQAKSKGTYLNKVFKKFYGPGQLLD